jgi:hypothetical protein
MSDSTFAVAFELLDGELARARVVSGPESVNGADTWRVSVYGGP